MKDVAKNIFVGGTGRSGTTILGEILSSHPRVHTFSRELRFHIDPYGLEALYSALSTRYTPPIARQAWIDFLSLMTQSLTKPASPPYMNFNLPKLFGQDTYSKALDELKRALITTEWKGIDYHLKGSVVDRKLGHLFRFIEKVGNLTLKVAFSTKYAANKRLRVMPSVDISEPSYFEDERELALILGAYFDSLLSSQASNLGCDVWCEQTPGNALSASFLAKAMPNSCLIYTKRDPWTLALSYQRQNWAPGNLSQICRLLQSQYHRWEAERAVLRSENYPFLEVDLEDLTENCEAVLGRVATLANLNFDFKKMDLLDSKKHQVPRESISKDDRDVLMAYFPNFESV